MSDHVVVAEGVGSDDVVVAVDVGATKVIVALADATGVLHTGAVARFPTPETPADLVEQIAAQVARLAPDVTPRLVACAAPGPLDAQRGVLHHMHNRHWVDVALGPMLTAELGAPVFLEDDATCAAMGEAVLGAGRGADPVGYLTVSSGVGAGLVLGGVPLRGAHGLAGEVGHLVIDPAGPLCGCGRRGDVEAYAGGNALAQRALEAWPVALTFDGTASPRTPAEIFALAATGEGRATALVEAAGRALAFALAALASTFDPEVIVVGGSIALAQPAWILEVTHAARALCMREIGKTLDVRLAELGDLGPASGAALLASASSG